MANKGQWLHIRIPSETKTLAEAQAAKLGMNLSEYIRYLIIEDSRK